MNKGFDFLSSQNIRRFLVDYGKQIRKAAAISILIIVAIFVFAAKGSGDGVELPKDDVAAASEETEAGAAGSQQAGSVFVDIGGAVVSPQMIELPNGSRVDDAIQAAGGLTKDADLSFINRAALVMDGEKIYIPSKEEREGAASDVSPGGSPVWGGGADGSGALDGSGAYAGDSAGGKGFPGYSAVQPSGGKVNINTADSAQLQTLNSIGPVTAQKIIDYRQSNGGFASIEEIKNVSGIGDKTFEKLKDFITTQ